MIDACAAPGNKTTHCAALLRCTVGSARGRVHAYDRDTKRLATLASRVALAGAAAFVSPRGDDFLKVTPETHAAARSARAILLDPSCSGSGIVSLERELQKKSQKTSASDEERRVAKLAAFQLKALTHALCDFPHVERVTYSTCSVHDAENEDVVAKALETQNKNVGDRPFKLSKCIAAWPRRGSPHAALTQHQSDCLLRADPSQDNCCGSFFEPAA